jgi:hypothetical protein
LPAKALRLASAPALQPHPHPTQHATPSTPTHQHTQILIRALLKCAPLLSFGVEPGPALAFPDQLHASLLPFKALKDNPRRASLHSPQGVYIVTHMRTHAHSHSPTRSLALASSAATAIKAHLSASLSSSSSVMPLCTCHVWIIPMHRYHGRRAFLLHSWGYSSLSPPFAPAGFPSLTRSQCDLSPPSLSPPSLSAWLYVLSAADTGWTYLTARTWPSPGFFSDR